MDFVNVEVLWHLIWILPFAVCLYYWASVKRNKLLTIILGQKKDDPQYSSVSKIKRLVRFVLLLASVTLLMVALARPYWGQEIIPYTSSGRDLLIVFDVSKSMYCQDVKPSRMKHAKLLMRQLVNGTTGDRYGIVAFAGDAFLECPMTVDKTSLFQVLDELTPGSIPLGGTNVQKALEKAIEAFKGAEGTHRAIVLVTDGDELDGDSRKSIDALKKMKIPLFVVGVGDATQPGLIMIPGENGQKGKYLRDRSGELVKSRLNEKQLKTLAIQTSGIYIGSTASNNGLSPLKRKVKELIPKNIDSGTRTKPIERFTIPILIAFFLLLIRMGISERRKNLPKSVAGVTLAPLFLIAFLTSNSIFAKDKKSDGKLDHVKQSDGIEIYNKALKLHKSKKNAKKVLELYETAINHDNKTSEVRLNSYQNMGVIAHNKARQTLANTQKIVQKDLNAALKNITAAKTIMDKAEEHYREAMRRSGFNAVAGNQQILLNDRKKAEELKKKIEKLKKKQEQAKKKMQQAQKQQKKSNQQKNQQQKQKEQQKAQQKTKEAEKSVNDLEKQAKKMNQKNLQKAAKKAKNELKKAQQAQQNKNGEKAKEHIDKAMKALKGADKKQQQNKKSDKNKQNKKQNKKKNQNKNQQPKNKNIKKNPGEKQPEKIDNKKIDPEQAKALLKLMAKDEKELRDKLKALKRQERGVRKVEKDW